MKTLAQKREKFLSATTGQTKKIGQRLAKEILKTKPGKKAVVICLKGELGSGKTTFIQGLATGFEIKEKVLSPTFVVLRRYLLPQAKPSGVSFKSFFYLDCYRLEKLREALALNFKEIINNGENILAIEWSEKIKPFLSQPVIQVDLKFISEKKRRITIKN